MLPPPPDHLIIERGRYTIAFALDANGKCPARDFLESGEPTKEHKARLATLFKKTAAVGPPTLEEHFKKLEGWKDVFEFKAHQARVFTFRDGDVWYLVSGVVKKKDKHKKTDIERSERIWAEHKARFPKQGKS
jgi:hypothetical protein